MATIYTEYSKDEPNDRRRLAVIRPEVMKARFLELFMQTAHVSLTCKILGMVPRTFYHWKTGDAQFAADFEMAEKVALGVIEDEITRRAVYGVEKPIFQGGKRVGVVTEYSDTLLVVLAKARAPHKYKERFSGELTGADGKPLIGEAKIIHVHSNIPLASSEDEIRIDDRVKNPLMISIDKKEEENNDNEMLDNI